MVEKDRLNQNIYKDQLIGEGGLNELGELTKKIEK